MPRGRSLVLLLLSICISALLAIKPARGEASTKWDACQRDLKKCPRGTVAVRNAAQLDAALKQKAKVIFITFAGQPERFWTDHAAAADPGSQAETKVDDAGTAKDGLGASTPDASTNTAGKGLNLAQLDDANEDAPDEDEKLETGGAHIKKTMGKSSKAAQLDSEKAEQEPDIKLGKDDESLDATESESKDGGGEATSNKIKKTEKTSEAGASRASTSVGLERSGVNARMRHKKRSAIRKRQQASQAKAKKPEANVDDDSKRAKTGSGERGGMPSARGFVIDYPVIILGQLVDTPQGKGWPIIQRKTIGADEAVFTINVSGGTVSLHDLEIQQMQNTEIMNRGGDLQVEDLKPAPVVKVGSGTKALFSNVGTEGWLNTFICEGQCAFFGGLIAGSANFIVGSGKMFMWETLISVRAVGSAIGIWDGGALAVNMAVIASEEGQAPSAGDGSYLAAPLKNHGSSVKPITVSFQDVELADNAILPALWQQTPAFKAQRGQAPNPRFVHRGFFGAGFKGDQKVDTVLDATRLLSKEELRSFQSRRQFFGQDWCKTDPIADLGQAFWADLDDPKNWPTARNSRKGGRMGGSKGMGVEKTAAHKTSGLDSKLDSAESGKGSGDGEDTAQVEGSKVAKHTEPKSNSNAASDPDLDDDDG
ncbi:Pectin lyase fold [Ceraceosorus bombacis]|uniref:Pectin lyase fold n=1 Tax=Ceraceosorus bombacis TaxID=401625 RepID=A0A0P1BFR8_9BASI|nr:Pectin lyase fold [Ceraceosorus bombacis]